MPRKADQQLESRIVDAAYQLWSKGGEHAVTMRAVALAAKTTTPTLYERFQDKHDLIVFMRVRARERMFAALQPARSSVEVCRLGLEFAIANGNEYLLLTSDWAERFARRERLPSYEYVQERLAGDLGGVPTDHAKLALALVAAVHGTAILLLGERVDAAIEKEFKHACLEACEVLIECGGKRVSGGAKG
ncbi:MAG TPA: helix-turn-helix domain-containing protein [Candidatus Acidoferrum sp.]|nr:helix-turn-helix domain-containing protein [Candidatus Acidoferrum sp.]